MKRTRGFYDDRERRARSFLTKVCDYGIAVLLLAGVLYSTYLDIQGRFAQIDSQQFASKQAKATIKSAIE